MGALYRYRYHHPKQEVYARYGQMGIERIRTDEAGNLYVTGKGVYIYNAQGKQIHFIEMQHRPSNCAFGEGDHKTLFITSGQNVYRARFDAQ